MWKRARTCCNEPWKDPALSKLDNNLLLPKFFQNGDTAGPCCWSSRVFGIVVVPATEKNTTILIIEVCLHIWTNEIHYFFQKYINWTSLEIQVKVTPSIDSLLPWQRYSGWPWQDLHAQLFRAALVLEATNTCSMIHPQTEKPRK